MSISTVIKQQISYQDYICAENTQVPLCFETSAKAGNSDHMPSPKGLYRLYLSMTNFLKPK